jgi:transglutaminase-like putative cysteine protease
MVALGRDIAKGETVYDMVKTTTDWVHGALKKVNVIGVPSALETLQSKRGDCNEHATLTVAILRTVGIPARIASGIAHLQGRFFHHAWVEYWDGAWHTVDPTWGQMPADLGHLRFIVGGLDRQVELIRILGKLNIQAGPVEEKP